MDSIHYSNDQRRPLRWNLQCLIAFCLMFGSLLMNPISAKALELQSICRIKGMETNELTGVGLVVGLNGTGDSAKKSGVMLRNLAELYRRHGFLVESLSELTTTDSIAVVSISVTVPGAGVREGELLDATVSTLGDASNLDGGQLLWTILRSGPGKQPLAKASGRISAQGMNPRVGTVQNGSQMIENIRSNIIPVGSFSATILLDHGHASIATADAIANRITQEFALDINTPGEVTAVAEDAKNIVVYFDPASQSDPNSLLASILTINLDQQLLQTPARVYIDTVARVITFSGDVEISPVALTTGSLTITRIDPEPVATAANPLMRTDRFSTLASDGSTQAKAKARLQDLVDMLKAMEVPFNEQVAVLHALEASGHLHAKVINN